MMVCDSNESENVNSSQNKLDIQKSYEKDSAINFPSYTGCFRIDPGKVYYDINFIKANEKGIY